MLGCSWRLEHFPAEVVPGPALPSAAFVAPSGREEFDALALQVQYQTLRTPADPSWRRLRQDPRNCASGAEKHQSLHRQNIVARRVKVAIAEQRLWSSSIQSSSWRSGASCVGTTRALTIILRLLRMKRSAAAGAGLTTEPMSPVALVRPGRVVLHAQRDDGLTLLLCTRRRITDWP
jgi:hypothetical protein